MKKIIDKKKSCTLVYYNRKKFFLIILFVTSLFSVHSSNLILKSSQNHYSELETSSETSQTSTENSTSEVEITNQTWERVVILKTTNYSVYQTIIYIDSNLTKHTKRILLLTSYNAKVNSSQISSIRLEEYLPENTTLMLLFENEIYQDYIEVKS